MKKSMRASGVWQALTVTGILLMGSGLVCAQNALVGMRGYVQDGVEFLRLDFAQDVQQAPRGFVLQTPPRITLDFPGFENQAPQSKWAFSTEKLESAQIFVAGERARIVLLSRNTQG